MLDINKLTIEELKAMAYDTIGEMERVQKNLQLLNVTIQKKSQEPKAEIKKEK